MKKEEFEAKHGRLPAHATYIDLDEQRRNTPPEVITGGWTDSQIRGKSEQEILAMVEGCERLIETLRQNVRSEEDRLYDLRAIQRRKQQLGD